MCCTITPTSQNIKSANIGRPFSNTSFYVMDETATLVVPRLGYGELCIGGPQLAREYYKRADLTEQRFVLMKDGRRIYRTGDNVRMLADGTFEYLNRTDDQVKIRGLRVELEEITHVLRKANSGIKDLSTLALQNPHNKTVQLVAFVTTHQLAESSAEVRHIDQETEEWNNVKNDMIVQARNELPDYMVPEIFIQLNQIPLSPAGKVDKRLLKGLYSKLNPDSSAYNNSLNADSRNDDPVSKKIISAFSRVSGVPIAHFHSRTNIHHLGIDSLSVSQVSRLLQDDGMTVTAAHIMEVNMHYSQIVQRY